MPDEGRWRRCSACKKDIAFGAIYWVCNVSTCNRKRTGLAFCSVSCWEVHLPMVNHRESWALEQRAPSSAEAEAAANATGARPRKPTVSTTVAGSRRPAARPREFSPSRRADQISPEILIVASRLKSYIRAQSGFNTSDGVLRPLSDFVRRACDEGLRNAARAERSTVMGRDIPGK